MKKSLLVLLVLACFVSASFPAVTGDPNRFIFGGTTGGTIFVRDYGILPSGKFDKLRDLSFVAKGPVGTITVSAPINNKFNLYYTYQDNGQPKGRNVALDYEKFEVLGERGLSTQFGTYSIGGFVTQAQSSNPFRWDFVDIGYNVVTQKTRLETGNPFGQKTQIFDNDNDFFPASTSIAWGGTHSAQILFQRSTGDFFGDFRSLTPQGKPVNDAKRYRFNSNTYNISVGYRYTRDNFNSYVVGTRDAKVQGTTYKTSVSLNKFDADIHAPVDSRLVYNYRSISEINLNAAILNTTYIYDAVDQDEPELSRSWLLYSFPKDNKLLTYSQQFNPFTLAKVQTQVLIGPNDPILRMSDRFYSLYGVGFYYDDDDYY